MDRRLFLKLTLTASGIAGFPGMLHAQSKPKPNYPTPIRFAEKDLTKLKITFHPRPDTPHHIFYCNAMMEGLKKDGINSSIAGFNEPAGADIAVMWSWKQSAVISDARSRGRHILVMERGFIQPRDQWCSLAFDGLNGFGTFAPAPAVDNGGRWQKYFAEHLQPWKKDQKGYALLIGQVPRDASLHGLHIEDWLNKMSANLTGRGIDVLYRPHPIVRARFEKDNEPVTVPAGTRLSNGTLEEDLAGAAYCVTYSSNTVVESVLAGVPALSFTRGSIGWPMSSHNLQKPIYTPDRTQWCHDMAWRQWKTTELTDGSAWDFVKSVIIA